MRVGLGVERRAPHLPRRPGSACFVLVSLVEQLCGGIMGICQHRGNKNGECRFEVRFFECNIDYHSYLILIGV